MRLTHFSWGKIGVMVLLRAKNWHFTTLLQALSKATETLSKSYRTLLAISFILIFQPCWRAYLDKMFATNQEGAIFWRTFCKIPWDCICAEISTCAKIIFWYISYRCHISIHLINRICWNRKMIEMQDMKAATFAGWSNWYNFANPLKDFLIKEKLTLKCKQMCSNIQYTSRRTKGRPC